jgi:hypothetical protein
LTNCDICHKGLRQINSWNLGYYMAQIKPFTFKLEKTLLSIFPKLQKRLIQLHVHGFHWMPKSLWCKWEHQQHKETNHLYGTWTSITIKLQIRKFCGSFRRRNVGTNRFKEWVIQLAQPFNSFIRGSHSIVLKATYKEYCYLLLIISTMNWFNGKKIKASQNFSLIPG